MENEYRISFFKPTTPQARVNRNLTIILFCIWAVAIFGFQTLLKILEKPTPEKALTEFNEVWGAIEKNEASKEELQTFASSVLSVLGKNSLQIKDREMLNASLSWGMFRLTPPSIEQKLKNAINDLNQKKAELQSLTDTEYIKAKTDIVEMTASYAGLPEHTVKAKLIPLSLISSVTEQLDASLVRETPKIMKKYCTHNQSVLTDIRFLGFPFHYFYTAVFLLILFIGLCWIYCIRIQSLNKKLGLAE